MDAGPIASPLIWLIALVAMLMVWSAARAALESLSEARLEKRSDEGDERAENALRTMERAPHMADALELSMLLAALISGAIAATRLAPSLATAMDRAKWLDWASRGFLLGFSHLLVMLVVLLAWMAATDSARHRAKLRAVATIPYSLIWVAKVTEVLMRPLTFLAGAASRGLLRLFRIDPDQSNENVTEEEILAMVDIGEEKGAIEKNEKELIENIFEFNNLSAEDCMTHRTFVTALWIGASDAEIVNTIEETGLSRFPVYGEDMDDILGVLTTRDYLLNARREKPKPLSELIRPAFFVPESAHTDRLLKEMQTRKTHMAIVVDEYGGMSGLITMEDLLEEIVGNIYDEFDPLAVQEIAPMPDGRFRVTGSAKLSALSETMGVDLPEDEEYDTVGGLVFSRLTTIPEDGSHPEVECYGLRIHVDDISDRRVAWATVEKVELETSSAKSE